MAHTLGGRGRWISVTIVRYKSVYHTYALCPWKPEEGTGSSRTGVRGSCMLPVGAGKRTQISSALMLSLLLGICWLCLVSATTNHSLAHLSLLKTSLLGDFGVKFGFVF